MKRFLKSYLMWKMVFLPILATAPEMNLSARNADNSRLEIEACKQEEDRQEILKLLSTEDSSQPSYKASQIKKVEDSKKIDMGKLALRLRDFEYDPRKNISSKGARGPHQFMPQTWYQVTKEIYGKPLPHHEADCPKISGRAAVKYLGDLDSFFAKKVKKYRELPKERRMELIVAGWNHGPNAAFERYRKGQAMPKETRDLTRLVLDSYNSDTN